MAGDHKTAPMVSAHSADVVWRAGGAIALYASRGWRERIVCLSYGERGESARLWKEGRINRRVQAERNSARKGIMYSGAYQRLFPQVTEELQ